MPDVCARDRQHRFVKHILKASEPHVATARNGELLDDGLLDVAEWNASSFFGVRRP
jgi:hypothetical protein